MLAHPQAQKTAASAVPTLATDRLRLAYRAADAGTPGGVAFNPIP